MMIKKLAKSLGVMGALVAMFALLAPSAMATETAPGKQRFAGCPSPSESGVPITTCFRTTVTSGNFKMGNKNVPITSPIVLTGGAQETLGQVYYNSKGGLLPAKQKVPGGIIGLTGLTWLAEFLGIEALTLYAETQLAGTAYIGFTETKLPVKVHLINSTLGNNCFVGSNSNPINLDLITGTTAPPPPNTPISGKFPEFHYNFEEDVLVLENGKYVDNSFSAPGASGCVLTLFGFIPISINGIVNASSGLPAAAGTNETVQNFGGEFINREFVYP